MYRLTSEAITDSRNGNHAASYQYDWVGNRTYETVNGVQTQYTYDDNDRLTQQGGTVYTYDNNGNTKTETLDGNTTTYTYNAKNKLTAVDKAGTTTGYTYNHNGIRTSKTHAGKTTHFIIDENRDYAQVLQEVENNAITVSYTYGHDLIKQTRGSTQNYYLYDGLGSTRALTNNAGVVTDTYNKADNKRLTFVFKLVDTNFSGFLLLYIFKIFNDSIVVLVKCHKVVFSILVCG